MSRIRQVMARVRLEDVHDDVLDRRLTTVIAGAGFGKTTVLETWIGRSDGVLHTVTAEDRALTTFGQSLYHALTPAVELPRDLPAALAAGGRAGDGEAARAHAFAAALCEALRERLRSDLLLMLDDVHHLGAQGPPVELLAALCRHAVPPLHVVVASREELPFSLERFRGRAELLDLGAADLAFTAEETAELLAVTIDPDAVALTGPLHAATGGWPAAVRLAVEVLRGVPTQERAQEIDQLGAAGGRLAGYLLHEVIEREPLAVRELLRTVAALPRFTAGLCEALGQPQADATIASLVRRGLFVERDGSAPGWFRVTEVARRFLLDHLALHEWERADVHLRAAAWFTEAGDHQDALRSLAANDDDHAVTSFLREHGATLLRGGATDAILDAFDRVPAEERDPLLNSLQGEALHVRGEWDAALVSFSRAAPSDGPLPAALGWRMGVIHHLRGDLEEALAVYARAADPGEPTRDAALLLAWHAAALWLRGEIADCARLAGEALDVATAADDDSALAAAHIARALAAAAAGDRAANDAHYARALDHAGSAGDVLQAIRVHANRSSHHLEEARYHDALAEADRALALSELAGFTAFRILALSNRGETLAGLGRLDESIVDLDAARALAQQTGSGMIAYPLGKLGDVHRIRGHRALARSFYEEARAHAEAAGDVQGLVPALAGLARVLVEEEADTAADLARQAIEVAVGLSEVDARLAAGWVALAKGDLAAAGDHADAAAATARVRRDRAGLADSLHLAGEAEPVTQRAVDLLEESLTLWQDIGDPVAQMGVRLALAGRADPDEARSIAAVVADRARALGVRPLATAAAALGTPPIADAPVAIRTLGGFAVLRNGQAVPRSAWQSRKARDLLRMMIARRGRMTARDVHMDALWPDADPSALSNRFSVALATIRAVLDPDKRFDPDHFVVADDDAVGLNITHLDVDVERFLADAEAGLALWRSGRSVEALERLAAAEGSYLGDFLEEDPYEEWGMALREQARARYLAVAHTLAEAAADTGDPHAAVRYLLRVLERDPYDEAAHLALVVNLQAAGHHGEARRSYRAYVARMEEIQVETVPMPAARAGARA